MIGQQQRRQILAASLSEVLLRAAAERDMAIAFVGKPHRIDDRGSQVPKARQILASEGFLDLILVLPNLMRKSDYHRLASLVPAAEIDAEVTAVLDAIVAVASKAQPMGE